MDNQRVKKNILILFCDTHLTYSPSTLNLFYKLKQHHDVELLSARIAGYYTTNQVTDPDIKYIDFKVKRTPSELLRASFYKLVDRVFKPSEATLRTRYLHNYKTKALVEYIKRCNRNIIAVDFFALWCVQKAGKQADILSLEIHENDAYFDTIELSTIKSVIIQSEERLNHLFPQKQPRYFIVQNAPRYVDFEPNYNNRSKKNLIFCGSAVYGFGIISCLDFLKDYKEYTLTVKGALPHEIEGVINKYYGDLVLEKRVVMDPEYLSAEDLTHYISKFRIGFAFYDFYRYSHLRTFNYATAPSGKVFQYLNSGVPIIANVLPGFEFIRKNHCGKLIDSLGSVQIKQAIDAIEESYVEIANNAKLLSQEYDFDKMIAPFLDYVEQEYDGN